YSTARSRWLPAWSYAKRPVDVYENSRLLPIHRVGVRTAGTHPADFGIVGANGTARAGILGKRARGDHYGHYAGRPNRGVWHMQPASGDHQRQRPKTSGSTNCNAGSGKNDTIQFSATGGMITLGSTLPVIVSGETLTIQGSTLSLPGITIDGGGTVQLMIVSSGATLNLQFLTLADGSVTGVTGGAGFGGAIYNDGTVTVFDSTFSANQATGGASASVGGNGDGGAISNFGMLTVTNSTFSANQTTNAGAGFGFGGAIFNLGTATVTNSTFSANQATTGAGGAVDGAIIG